MKQLFVGSLLTLLVACGGNSGGSSDDVSGLQSYPPPGWSIGDSPYKLLPGKTISVCDTGVKAGVKQHVMNAVRIWLDTGGRDERIKVTDGCNGDRVVRLEPVPNTVSYYGQASPLSGTVHKLNVPPKWAGHWTANHEVGHVFGFAHKFGGTISIMNSENNGQYMNGGQLSDYDRSEVKRMLDENVFNATQAAWD